MYYDQRYISLMKNQQGYALLVSMTIMLLISLISAIGLQSGIFENAMAHNQTADINETQQINNAIVHTERILLPEIHQNQDTIFTQTSSINHVLHNESTNVDDQNASGRSAISVHIERVRKIESPGNDKSYYKVIARRGIHQVANSQVLVSAYLGDAGGLTRLSTRYVSQ